MKLPRGVRAIRGRLFGRIFTKRGGEISFPLGDVEANSGSVTQEYYATRKDIRAALSRGFDENDVKAALREGTLHSLLAPKEPEPERAPTVREAADRWLTEKVDADLEPRNAGCVRSRVEEWLLPFMGTRPITSVRRADCHAYKGHLHAERPDLKPSTLKHYLRDLRELLFWCEDAEIVDRFESPWPRRGIMPRVPREEKERFTDAEIKQLLSLPHPHGTAVALMLQCGLRWGEACRATRRDLTSDGHLLVRRTKNGKPRTVPAPQSLVDQLRRRVGRFVPFSERCSGSFNKTVRNKIDVEGFHCHRLRHEFTSRYREAAGEPEALRLILGHATAQQTSEYGGTSAKFVTLDARKVHAAWEGTSDATERAG